MNKHAGEWLQNGENWVTPNIPIHVLRLTCERLKKMWNLWRSLIRENPQENNGNLLINEKHEQHQWDSIIVEDMRINTGKRCTNLHILLWSFIYHGNLLKHMHTNISGDHLIVRWVAATLSCSDNPKRYFHTQNGEGLYKL